LSCFFQNPQELLPDFGSTMPPEAFYHAGHREIYDVLLEMLSANHPIEFPAVCSFLHHKGRIDRVGGASYLAEIYGSMMSTSSYRHFKKILHDKLALRKLIEICNTGINLAHEHSPTDSVQSTLDAFEQSVLNVRTADEAAGRGRPFKELVQGALDRYEQAILSKGALPGISTGFRKLDNATGGMRKGQVWTIAGGTSDGKSAFVQNIIKNVCNNNVSSCIYTLEMTDEENTDRFFSMQSSIPSQAFLYGLKTREEMRDSTATGSQLQKWPLEIRDVSGIKLAALRADMRSQVRRYKTRVFAIDYLQLVGADAKGHNREREVADISAAMKTDAKLLGVTILNLSQLNDDGKLRESRAIGQDSDVIALIRQVFGADKASIEDKRDLDLVKVRGGQRGVSISMHFHGSTYSFKEATE